MSDRGLPIVMDRAAADVYVDWEGVDFLADTRDAPIAIEFECSSPEEQVEDHTRATFRSALITSLLETDALKKSEAFEAWLKPGS